VTPTESIPLLIVVVLLLSASGVDPDAMTIHYAGDRDVATMEDVLIVAGGSVSVPADAAIDGQVYVIDGQFEVAGTVDGSLTQLAGSVAVPASGTITGEFQTIAGRSDVAAGATVGSRQVLEVDPREAEGGGAEWLLLLLQILGLGLLGYLLGRRQPALLENVGRAVTDHPGVSSVTGGFAGTVLLVLIIAMAFTIVLIPVSVIGLGVLVLTVAYGQVAIGYRLVQPLGIRQARWRAALGGALVAVLLEVLGTVPLVGGLAAGVVALAGLGAVLITYYGLRRFVPPTIPGPA